MIVLIYHNMLWMSIQEYQNSVLIEGVVKNAMRIISVLNAYYGRITKIMRIACVLDNLNCKHALITQKEGR